MYAIRCPECPATFTASRAGAETCSGKCRERRRKRRAAAEVERASALLALQSAALVQLTRPPHAQENPTP